MNLRLTRLCSILTATATALTVTGCANLWTAPNSNSAANEAEAPIESVQPPTPRAPTQLAIPGSTTRKSMDASQTTDLYWQVPGEPVEWYHIYYGLSPASLDQHLAIKTVDLEKFPSAEYGAVFRYTMSVPKGQTIYLKIVSENKVGKSTDSQLIKVTNGKQEAVKK